MFPVPAAAEPLVGALRQAFTKPTFDRFVGLMAALIVTMGRRSVSRALRILAPVGLNGHWSNFHRIYSQAKFDLWQVCLAMLRQAVALLPADQPIILLADDTVDGREGDKVWAKGTHRDATRSSRSCDNLKFGHRWLVMCVLVWLPGTARPWALPVACGLCRSKKVADQAGVRPKTPSELTLQLLMRLMRWLPERKFILIGDYGVISHPAFAFAHRHADRVTVVSRMRCDTRLYAAPTHPGRKTRTGGRPGKGRLLQRPHEQVDALPQKAATVSWYGSSRRKVCYVSCTGLWYGKHTGGAVVPVRWVCVRGKGKDALDQYFFCSNQSIDPVKLIEHYASRWNIEVTFQEGRAHLGWETTRHWCKQSVLRVWPLLVGLFTAVSLTWNQLHELGATPTTHGTPCYQKTSMTFGDALYEVRRATWDHGLLRHQVSARCRMQIPPTLRTAILTHLAAAA